MRKLKFRVWDKTQKLFLDDSEFYIWEGVAYTHPAFSEINGIIQQSTCSKDKNNKEIFEGDIVKTDISHISHLLKSPPTPIYIKGIVEFINCGFNVCQEYIGRTRLEDFVTCDCCPCGLEIIGNIFENTSEKEN